MDTASDVASASALLPLHAPPPLPPASERTVGMTNAEVETVVESSLAFVALSHLPSPAVPEVASELSVAVPTEPLSSAIVSQETVTATISQDTMTATELHVGKILVATEKVEINTDVVMEDVAVVSAEVDGFTAVPDHVDLVLERQEESQAELTVEEHHIDVSERNGQISEGRQNGGREVMSGVEQEHATENGTTTAESHSNDIQDRVMLDRVDNATEAPRAKRARADDHEPASDPRPRTAGDEMDTSTAVNTQDTVAHEGPNGTRSGPEIPRASSDEIMVSQSQVDGLSDSQSRNVREREEEDDGEDGPTAKRARTNEKSPAEGEFRVPDLPPLSTTGLPMSAPAPEQAQDRSSSYDSEELGHKPLPTGPLTKAQHAYLVTAVRNLKRNRSAPPFNTPVDPVKLKIPTYPDLIKHPMDLATIEGKLKRNEYVNVDEYIDDFYLIVQNTHTFNGPDHIVTKQADVLQEYFRRQLDNFPSPDVLLPDYRSKKSKKASAPRIPPPPRPARAAVGAAASPTHSHPATSPTFALGPSGTPVIRRDSTLGDGRPKREIHPPPPKDLPYTAAKPKKKKYQLELKFCQHVLDELFKPKHRPYAAVFYQPVDVVALNIPHYHRVVKKPMDMATLRDRLKAGEYENAKEFEADVRLMFRNCASFNPPGDAVHAFGKRLEDVFDKEWDRKEKWIKGRAPPARRPSAGSSPEPDDDGDSDDSDEEEEEAEAEQSQIMVLQKQIELMSKQVELIQKKKSSPPSHGSKKKSKGGKADKKAGKKRGGSGSAAATAIGKSDKKKKSAKKEKTPYVTYEQKREISNRINTLPPARMTEALHIIRDNMPVLDGHQDEELELDIDELSDYTLYQLYHFVRKYAPGLSPPEEPVKPARPSAASGAPKPKKNKPMSKLEQEARINELQGKLKSYQQGGAQGPSPSLPKPTVEPESSGDDEESGSESEEE
ncbi:MAG: hypothetical protein M1826_007484 [Phylliscum demangeonii]|nr:MAG: hypothetical protein M1826_007484 [Phylliscum demangeonii]